MFGTILQCTETLRYATTSAMQIAHISDLHFGRISHPGVVSALIEEVNEAEIDLVALSGDLTQRARHREFQAVRDMLEAFDPPVLVVSGNHDVYPWWNPVRRLSTPLKRYRRYVTDELAPTFETDTTSVLGLTSAHGATIKSGRIGPSDRAVIRDYFGSTSADRFKVLVVHHHLTRIRSIGWHGVARQAQKTLDVAADVGVNLILCGHLHVSHIEPLDVIPGEHRIVIASAGTATSNRWRSPTGPVNFYNVVTIDSGSFQVEERRFVPSEDRFVRDSTTRFDRAPGHTQVE